MALVLLIVAGQAVSRRVRQRVESQRKLIDDFNDGADPNLVGGHPFTMASEGSEITGRYVETLAPGRGGRTYLLEVQLAPDGLARWATSLNGLDISAATHLSLWIRVDPAAHELVAIQLVDRQNRTASLLLAKFLAPHARWQRLRLPIQLLPGVDLNQLDQLHLRLDRQPAFLRTTIGIDDVAFEGPEDVFFHSLRDNLGGFPARRVVESSLIARLPDSPMLRVIANSTWQYFRNLVDTRHALPLNSIHVNPIRHIGDYASTTDIAMYLLGVVSAYDFEFIDQAEALRRIRATLAQLASLDRWNHLFYNYYSTTNLQVTNPYVSSVDNGWLAAALIVLRQTFPELAPLCASFLDEMDFHRFYDEQLGQMRLGYDAGTGGFAPYHYGLLASEARMLSLVAIGKRDVPEQHWFRIYRTLPKEWTWQRQIPQGHYRQYRGYDVFQGHYTSHDVAVVPSWGGSLFEFLMPTLLVKERELAPQGLGLNDQRAVDLHMQYALEDRRYPVWGLSPCATPRPQGGYAEFGVAELGTKGYPDRGVVTPHSSVLALEFAPKAVLKNLRQLLRRYPIYGEYGFYDAVDVTRGEVAYRYLALDQGMILIAINNYLNDGIMRNRFHADPIGQEIEWLLESEELF